MKKLILSKNIQSPNGEKFGRFAVESQYTVSTYNSRGAEAASYDDSKIMSVQFDDGTEWFTYADDLEDIYDTQILKNTRGEIDDEYVLPSRISNSTERGLFSNIISKVILFKTPKKKNNFNLVYKNIDEKLMPEANEGMFKVNRAFERIPVLENEISGNVLLFIHGTFSTFEKAFKDIRDSDVWEYLFEKYDTILAYNHKTLSVSPFDNVQNLFRLLPDEIDLDIISHSRGGILADIICRFDRRNESIGFNKYEIELLGQDDKDILVLINELIEKKSITVNQVLKVASPSGGTSLMTKRLDHFLNFTLNALTFAIGFSNPLITIIKELLLEVLNSRLEVESSPGLHCMSPDSSIQKIINNRTVQVKSKIYCISGDGTIGASIKNTLFVILSNLYYQNANDWVVDTNSMKKGVCSYEGGVHEYLLDGYEVNHFSYFKNKNILDQIKVFSNKEVTRDKFKFISVENMDRSWIDRITFSSFSTPLANGKKPVFLIIPGIMGSTLKNTKTDERLWANIPAFTKGSFVDKLQYDPDNNDIAAYGAISTYYERMADKLNKFGDVELFPFDWRLDLKNSAALLDQRLKEMAEFKKVIILAHSMGGLVVKELIGDPQSSWNAIMRNSNNKTIFLGTPWTGSHLILDIFFGENSKVKLLSSVDPFHDKEKVIDTISNFPGVLQLLPYGNPKESFNKIETWSAFSTAQSNFKTPNNLNIFSEYTNRSLRNVISDHKDRIFYVAGYNSSTLTEIVVEKSKGMERTKVVRRYTNAGDGSTVWKYSIPKNELNSDNIYYTNAKHENLLADDQVYEIILKLFNGSKVDFKYLQPIIKNEVLENRSVKFVDQPFTNEEIFRALLFENSEETDQDVNLSNDNVITVSVNNSDLKYSKYPIMVGHFKNDGIYSAERRLDGLLGKKLSERHAFGLYPSNIGESAIIFQYLQEVNGGIIVGLGKQDELSGFHLSKSVESAVLKYSFFCRDTPLTMDIVKYSDLRISTVIIGSNYAGLSINESINSIITGVRKANEKIISLNNGQKTIGFIEFVEFYEDVAEQAYRELFNEYSDDESIIIHKYKSGLGSKKRMLRSDKSSWWQTFTTSTNYSKNSSFLKREIIGLTHTSNSGRARVEKKTVDGNMKLIEQYVNEYSSQVSYNPSFSKTLFELLIPNEFKSVLRQQKNISWRLDEYTAQFPWELLHDSSYGGEPAFVKTGMIRQLYTEDFEATSNSIENRKAIVINPDYTDNPFYADLPGAKREAESVRNILNNNMFETNDLIDTKPAKIVNELFSQEYKIVHISGHGIYEEDKENNTVKSGIVLNEDIILDPNTIKQLSAIPEFIFINCCYSGKMNHSIADDKNINRVALAASIGTQLIKMGVKAIVIAGWAVEDNAAKTFAEELYKELFKGKEFGEAVKVARQECYEKHKNSNTWAAYQCYGEYYYKLINYDNTDSTEVYINTEGTARIALENIFSDMKTGLFSAENLEKIKNKVFEKNLDSLQILELLANIHFEAEQYDEAWLILKQIKEKKNLNYNIALLELYCRVKIQLFDRFYNDYNEILEIIEFLGKHLIPEKINDLKYAFYKSMLIRIYDPNSQQFTNNSGYETILKSFGFVKDISIPNNEDVFSIGYHLGKQPYTKEDIDLQFNDFFVANKDVTIKDKPAFLKIFRMVLQSIVLEIESNLPLEDFIKNLKRENFSLSEIQDEIINIQFLIMIATSKNQKKSISLLQNTITALRKNTAFSYS